jgi:hypothetical protein
MTEGHRSACALLHAGTTLLSRLRPASAYQLVHDSGKRLPHLSHGIGQPRRNALSLRESRGKFRQILISLEDDLLDSARLWLSTWGLSWGHALLIWRFHFIFLIFGAVIELIEACN